MTPSPRQLKRIAFHEAGHAVIGCLVGIPFTTVRLTPDNRVRDSQGMIKLGSVKLKPVPDWVLPLNWSTNEDRKRARNYLKNNICMTLAGPLAETLHTGCWQQETRGEGNDETLAMLAGEVAREWGVYLHWTPKDSQNWVNRLRFQILEILHDPRVWAAVALVARELVKHGTLRAKDVYPLVNQAVPRAPAVLRRKSLKGS